jgi:hypothetical protein
MASLGESKKVKKAHDKGRSLLVNLATLAFAALLWSPDLSSGILGARYGTIGLSKVRSCDVALPLRDDERADLLQSLAATKTGESLLSEYIKVYGSLDTLVIQWDQVSYSQINRATTRLPASAQTQMGSVVCVHLARRLPQIEHLADLAHEMVHATRLSEEVLKGEGLTSKEFVHARIAAPGGEADAFAVECAVKKEAIGRWDQFCGPYVHFEGHKVDQQAVVRDLYNGALSASLTGEAYPVMLTKQYQRMRLKRTLTGVFK